jgi:hypothetical protein
VTSGDTQALSRTPVEVYQGIVETQLDEGIPEKIQSVVNRFTDSQFAGERVSVHLTRLLSLFTRFIAHLNNRVAAGVEDVTNAIDLLDYFTSTSRWWTLTRKDPGLVMRPPSREPRDFIKSVAELKVGSPTLQRISDAAERLGAFLEEHSIGDTHLRANLCNSFVSSWALVSAFACKGQGRSVTGERDFETAYDMMRVLLFYTNKEDYQALTAVRLIGTNPRIPRAADVAFSPSFDKRLESSIAASLEKNHGTKLVKMATATSGASRSILTNSLRLLAQLKAVEDGIERLEDTHYDTIIPQTLLMFERIGLSPAFLQDESSALAIFQGLRPASGVDERIHFLVRRLEGLIVDATGNKDFLLQYARAVPRLVALLLLLASKTRASMDMPIEDIDLKRGLILLERLISQ